MNIRFPVSVERLLGKAMKPLASKFKSGLRADLADMSEEDYMFLIDNLNFHHINCAENMKIFSRFSLKSREEFARRSRSLVVYFPEEADVIKNLEEVAALQAAPPGHLPENLNGINIGCGDRRILEYLTPVDIMRKDNDVASGAHHAFLKDAILANPEDLPFKESSLDYIAALHMLEHVSNPMEILRYWGTLLKPGGGIGLILPNYEYTWDAQGDHSHLGHKWNANAEIFSALYNEFLSDMLILEQIDTLPYKISFDVVLRRPGEFQAFQISNATSLHSGAELAQMGLMVGKKEV